MMSSIDVELLVNTNDDYLIYHIHCILKILKFVIEDLFKYHQLSQYWKKGNNCK